jgi:hypothetical protein
MAERKITNAAQIAAAQAQNLAAQAKVAEAQAKAAAADAARKPVLKQTVAGIGGINKATQEAMAIINNPKSSQAQINKALADAKVASAAQKTNLASITPEQRQMAIEQGQIFTSAMSDVEKYNAMMVNVPGATYEEDTNEAERLRRAGQSAYDILLAEFSQYGLSSLVEPLKNLITSGPSAAELTLALRATDAYKKRFAANAERIKKGLTALNEATYLGLEDQYQSLMRNYGLPATYYSKDTMGRQEGFEKLIANDVSSTELEDRILTAQNRVINAPAEVTTALKQFYPDITNGDILAYTLDPEKALTEIKRKVTAAEIGGAAIGAGLGTSATRAEELAKFGVTGATARQGYQAAVPLIERGRQLSAFYEESPYTQATAEEELFNLSGAAGATEKRKRLSALETAEFSGRSGLTGGALSRDRAGAY